jgi:hypothetical protein
MVEMELVSEKVVEAEIGEFKKQYIGCRPVKEEDDMKTGFYKVIDKDTEEASFYYNEVTETHHLGFECHPRPVVGFKVG